jgi:hypothetical protein
MWQELNFQGGSFLLRILSGSEKEAATLFDSAARSSRPQFPSSFYRFSLFLFSSSLLPHASIVTLYFLRPFLYGLGHFSNRWCTVLLYTRQNVWIRLLEPIPRGGQGKLTSEHPEHFFSLIPIVTDMVTLQTVVITGGSEGMGKAVACQLAEKGANVVIVARTLQKLQESMEAIRVSSHHSPFVMEALC